MKRKERRKKCGKNIYQRKRNRTNDKIEKGQYSTVQDSTVQYVTAQLSTVQDSTGQDRTEQNIN